MNNKVIFEVYARPEIALKKLAKAQIPVSNLKINGAKIRFGVNREYSEKVFAIFNHPCYNTVIKQKSARMRFASFCKNRLGILIGAAAFLIVSLASQSLVLRIKITGNADYLSPQILQLADECGAREWTTCSRLDKPLLRSKITALSGVEFCSVTRQGWFLVIDVHAQDTVGNSADYSPLYAEKSGRLYALTAICGTPEKNVGDEVEAGDVLIAAYETSEDGTKRQCLAVGFAEIEIHASLSLFYESENEQNTQSALSATSLYSERVLEKSYRVKPCDGGVYYEVTFTYLYIQSCNMD